MNTEHPLILALCRSVGDYIDLDEACRLREVCKDWNSALSFEGISYIFKIRFEFERSIKIKDFSGLNTEMIRRRKELKVILHGDYYGNTDLWKDAGASNLNVYYSAKSQKFFKKTDNSMIENNFYGFAGVGEFYLDLRNGYGHKVDENGQITTTTRFKTNGYYHCYRWVFHNPSFPHIYPSCLFSISKKGNLKQNTFDFAYSTQLESYNDDGRFSYRWNIKDGKISLSDEQPILFKCLLYHYETNIMSFVDEQNLVYIYAPFDGEWQIKTLQFDSNVVVHLAGSYDTLIIYETRKSLLKSNIKERQVYQLNVYSNKLKRTIVPL